jgi:hypothetical protein
VPALVVVEDLDILDDRRTGLGLGGEVRAVDEFFFQGSKKGSSGGSVLHG